MLGHILLRKQACTGSIGDNLYHSLTFWAKGTPFAQGRQEEVPGVSLEGFLVVPGALTWPFLVD